MTAVLYFGTPWAFMAFDTAERVDTPIGDRCLWCNEPIVDGDQGTIGAVMTAGFAADSDVGRVVWRPKHRECELRQVVGSIGHLLGVCSCFGGSMEDPPGLTERQSALLVWAWVRTFGVERERR